MFDPCILDLCRKVSALISMEFCISTEENLEHLCKIIFVTLVVQLVDAQAAIARSRGFKSSSWVRRFLYKKFIASKSIIYRTWKLNYLCKCNEKRYVFLKKMWKNLKKNANIPSASIYYLFTLNYLWKKPAYQSSKIHG